MQQLLGLLPQRHASLPLGQMFQDELKLGGVPDISSLKDGADSGADNEIEVRCVVRDVSANACGDKEDGVGKEGLELSSQESMIEGDGPDKISLSLRS